MVRSLPHTVRLPRQRSTRLSYQGNKEKNQNNNQLWKEFQEYLLSTVTEHTAKVRLSYARRYASILSEGNAQELLTLSHEKRFHVMKSLAALSKYIGEYDRWKHIIERYHLKWSRSDGIKIFDDIMNNTEENYSSMLNWLKHTCSKLPSSYYNILIYCALTGLRPKEAVQSLSLLRNHPECYLKGSTVLEHFKHPDIFIRRTKKAYISIISDCVLDVANRTGNHSYNSLRLAIKRTGLNMNMAFCRKIFATHLRNNGIEPEIIDLLQERIPKSVFVRHYFRPDFSSNRIKECIDSLYNVISTP
jgi:intergrase/recombinase